jgi:putative protease
MDQFFMNSKVQKVPELLAPAGTIEVFETAIEAGADAIYIGAPALNARALAKSFTWPEMAAMVSHAHQCGTRVYSAMNSLMKEDEVPQAVETLALLESIKIDALIIQDPGIYYLARKHFPHVRLHASTLMGAHNSLAAAQFADMGFARVVLPREMTLEEIKKIRANNPVELEVFVHGALCFSYSGLCLFSSALGGKSGLRGRCVQPCRRRYTWQGKGKGSQAGYFFSMNDLEALDQLPQLIDAGITSFKIEGRMRSAQYVSSVVSAYRLVLDDPGDSKVTEEAHQLLGGAMGRKPTKGYFLSAQPDDALSPQHSGNIGHFLGKVTKIDHAMIQLTLKSAVKTGDRLRLHHEKSGERTPFTLKKLRSNTIEVDDAVQNDRVHMEVPFQASVGDSLYLVDVAGRRGKVTFKKQVEPARFKNVYDVLKQKRYSAILKNIDSTTGRQVPAPKGEITSRPPPGKKMGRGGRRNDHRFTGPKAQGTSLPLWVRVDDFNATRSLKASNMARLIINLDRVTYNQFHKYKKHLKPYLQQMVWALPPVIEEEMLQFYGEAIGRLMESGFKTWQIGHMSQLQFFKERGQCTLLGDYTLNVLNSMAVRFLQESGVHHIQLSVEEDRDSLKKICMKKGRASLGGVVYGQVPLFIARLMPNYFRFNQLFVSPKGEKFTLQKRWGLTVALPAAVFSLLPWLHELAKMGMEFGVVDLSGMSFRAGILESLLGIIGKPLKKGQSSFNYSGKLQ